MSRTLVLRRERLVELTSADLAAIPAAAPPDHTYTCLTGPCICDLRTLTCP